MIFTGVIVVSVSLAIVAVSLGGSADSKEASTKTEKAGTVESTSKSDGDSVKDDSAAKAAYVKRQWMKSCQNEMTRATCKCMHDTFVDRIGVDKFVTEAIDYSQSGTMSEDFRPVFRDAVVKCAL